MKKKEAKKLFKKYEKNKSSKEEEALIDNYLDSFQGNDNDWPEWKLGDQGDFEKDMLKNIKSEFDTSSKVISFSRILKSSLLKYAAVVAGLLLLATQLWIGEHEVSIPLNEEITEITLELEDGSTTTITQQSNKEITLNDGEGIIEQKDETLIYGTSSKSKKVAYNTLKIPLGKKFNIALSDGTQIMLNSGSSLTYPTHFIKGKERRVYLNGEAFFKVAKNKNDVFIVKTTTINTHVYGTEFNITAYSEDDNSRVVLVEGSVGVESKNAQNENALAITKLIPNQMAMLENEAKEMTIEEVDINEYMAWTKDILFFKNDSFEMVMNKLKRHYNIEFENHYKALNNERFNGSFDGNKEVEYILDIFTHNMPFNYKIINNTIQINQH